MKKILFITLILSLLFVQNAFAHTGLESSFPQDGAVLTEEVKTITLTFESKIEQGSTFELKNSAGESIPVENILLSENEVSGNIINPLENGEYQVNWSIIGADGHPIDGVVSFSVEVPVSETPVEQDGEEIEQEGTADDVKLQEKVEDNSQKTEQTKSSSTIIPVLIGILAVIIVVSFVWITKRKK